MPIRMVLRLVRTPIRRFMILTFVVCMFIVLYQRSSVRAYSSRHHGYLADVLTKRSTKVAPYIKILGVCLPEKGNQMLLREFLDKDVEISTRTEGTKTCCDVSVTEIKCGKATCSFYLFGDMVTYNTMGWHAALYKGLREAYIIGTDYFLISPNCSALRPGWAEKYVNSLQNINPPNFGMGILSSGNYIFFHRTHFSVFGYAFPSKLKAEDVYSYLYNLYPSQHRIWLDVSVGEMEPRQVKVTTKARPFITEHQHTLSWYDTALQTSSRVENDFTVKVVSMSLYGSSNRYIEGAIRNAQLMPLILPGWKLRMYVPHPDMKENILVRPEVIQTLKRLGTEVRFVNDDVRNIVPPMMWRFLVADDPTVDIFLIQDCDSRVGERLAAGVNEWLKQNATVYCMRDHPWHAYSSLSGGMWGARRRGLEAITNGQFITKMTNYEAEYMQDMKFLGQVLWPLVKDDLYCHDSVACDMWPHTHPWPVARRGLEHVGEIYNEYHVPFPSNRIKMYNTTQNMECEPSRRIYLPPPV